MADPTAQPLQHCSACGHSLIDGWCSWCGAQPRPQLVGRFEVVGAFPANPAGSLLLARDPALARQVVIRILRPWASPGERLTLGTIRHPNCVPVFAVLDLGRHVALVMEYLPGGLTLREPEARVLTAIRQVGSGLDFVHQHGLVHGRLSLNNILLTAEGVAKLADIGLPVRAGLDQYVAPEVRAGAAVTSSSDVYSLAAIAMHAITGTPPKAWQSRGPQVPDAVAALARFCGPEQSRGTAAELVEALQYLP